MKCAQAYTDLEAAPIYSDRTCDCAHYCSRDVLIMMMGRSHRVSPATLNEQSTVTHGDSLEHEVDSVCWSVLIFRSAPLRVTYILVHRQSLFMTGGGGAPNEKLSPAIQFEHRCQK